MTTPRDGERWTEAVRGYLSRTTPVVPPIYQCTTFELDEHSYRGIVECGGFKETWYTRFGNPTVAWAADAVARLEHGRSPGSSPASPIARSRLREKVFVATREEGHGSASGAAVAADNYMVLSFREGNIARYQEFYDGARARAALGEAAPPTN
jgi:ketosteroid isomerase-like protein